MAGKNETPRQKMIGMMYLVLTALLALNVSKEVIAAFVTINDKIDGSIEIVELKSLDNYSQFDQKKAGLIASKSSLTDFNIWSKKAHNVKSMTNDLVNFIMSESNEMIKTAEGIDWVESRKENGHIKTLKPLINIRNMDNYDIPTNIFVGNNPTSPNTKGLEIQKKIHAFRDSVCAMMGNISKGEKSYSFSPPYKSENLEAALQTVLPDDKQKIKQVYQSLTIPEQLKSYSDQDVYLPWASVMFDHAPIVAAASLLNALKLDIKNSEAEISNVFLEKVEAPIFVFNKIEPLPFAKSRYINSGDSLEVNVMVAAYDSTSTSIVRYGIDSDTLEDKWKETKGKIDVVGTVGNHKIKGAIGVKEHGDLKWKPWSFEYTVGQPMAVIAQPEMRILYSGYDNVIEATASGYPSESIRVSCSGCTASKISGQRYHIKTAPQSRTANISISAIKEDGTRVNLGNYAYRVKPTPKPETFLGTIKNGDRPSHNTVISQRRLSIRFGNDVNLKQIPLRIVSGHVVVNSLTKQGKVLPGGGLDSDAISILRQSRGKTVTIFIKYKDPAHQTRIAQPIVFTSV